MKQIMLDEWIYEQQIFDMINDNMPIRYQAVLANRSYAEGASRPEDYASGESPRRRKRT